MDDVSFHFVPARHWTRRSLFDMNTSHWGGWIIKNDNVEETIYFVETVAISKVSKKLANAFQLILPLCQLELMNQNGL
ncbi:hypothetical protein ACT7DH_10080 [Bacillus pacificus]